MPDTTSLRYRYAQFFVLLLLSYFIYVMVQSIKTGTNNFQEGFYQKNFLIEKASLLRLKLGDQAFPEAVIGKNGWMEYTGEWIVDDIQNLRTFDTKESLLKGLVTLDQSLKSQGITLLIVIAPNKGSIYPENTPQQLTSLPVPSRLDNLLSYLQENNLASVDLRSSLQEARKDHDVYYKTDTHWNGYGAFIAYTTIINALKSSYPELKPYEAADLIYQETPPDIREVPGTMRVTTIMEPGSILIPPEPFVQTLYPGLYDNYNQLSWIPDSTLPTILMFHDSFGARNLNDYISMNFSKSHFVHLSGMPKYLTPESVEYFQPDIIVIEIVERNLQDLPLYYPAFMLE